MGVNPVGGSRNSLDALHVCSASSDNTSNKGLVVSRSYRTTSDATLELAQSKSLCGLRVNFVDMSRIAHRQERPLAAAGSAVDVDRSEQTP